MLFFSENVTSDGSVTVTIETGDIDRKCTFTVLNSSSGTCNYTVQAGDISSDLNASISGTIADQSSNPLENFNPASSLLTNKDIVLDTSDPAVLSLSPSDNATGISGTTNLVIEFDQIVDVESGDIVIKKTSGDSTVETISLPDVKVTGTGTNTITINPSVNLLAGTQYYIQIANSAFDDVSGNSYAGITDTTSWSFTILRTSSSSYSSAPAPAFYSVEENDESIENTAGTELTDSPSAKLSLENNKLNISWSSSPSIHLVDLFVSFDNKGYYKIASNIINNEIYQWNLPSVCPGKTAKVKIIGTDLAVVLASVETNEIDLLCLNIIPDEENDNEADVEVSNSVNETNELSSSVEIEGPSPVTGEIQKIAAVEPGDYIRSPYFATVYYIDSDLSRRPFINSSVFLTYEDSFDAVKTVTDATLATLNLGQVMLPNPESVLVKIVSDPRTYSIDESGSLRWIASEQVAKNIFGTDWSDYIIDIEPTFFRKFNIGNPINYENEIEKSDKMKKREMLY